MYMTLMIPLMGLFSQEEEADQLPGVRFVEVCQVAGVHDFTSRLPGP